MAIDQFVEIREVTRATTERQPNVDSHKSERSAQEGDWPLTGFSPRKQNLSIYIMPGFKDYKPLLDKIGKHKTSVGCLYINKLSDIDKTVLKKLIVRCVKDMKKMYP